MERNAAFDLLLGELGSLVGIPELRADADLHCGLVVDAGTAVHLQFDPTSEAVTVYATAGQLPDAGRAEALELLMAANLFWQGTGGATLGLNQADGSVVAAQRVALTGLAAHPLMAIVQSVADVAATWADMLGGLAGRDLGAPPTPLPATPRSGGMLRV
jgi:Tir chaperone protein (CesT) family